MPLKFGVVTETDPANCRVRVKYQDNEGIESYWLAVLQRQTFGTCDYHMPKVGEQVACHIDEHNEEGVVLGALYSSADPTPVSSQDKRHVTFADGAVLEYDEQAHQATVKLPGQARVSIGKEGYLEVQGATVIVLHDAADIDCRKTLNVRAKDGIVYWIPTATTVPYQPANIPEGS